MNWESTVKMFKNKVKPYKIYNNFSGRYSEKAFSTELQANAYMKKHSLNRKIFEIRRVEIEVIW